MSERQLQDAVVEMARWRGWLVYHTHDSRRSEPGFPDLILLRGRRMMAVELKSATGALTVAQIQWLQGFAKVADSVVEVETWRPKHWTDGTIEARLS